MVGMPTVNSMRQRRRGEHSVSGIARMNGVSRDIVRKHLRKDDFSPHRLRQRRRERLADYVRRRRVDIQ